MSDKLEITKEAVLKASERCPDAKKVLKQLFPSVFIKIEHGGIYYNTITNEYRLIIRHWVDGTLSKVDCDTGHMYGDSEESIREEITTGRYEYIGHIRDLKKALIHLHKHGKVNHGEMNYE